MKSVPVVPHEPSLSGSALGLWGQQLVQHAQDKPTAIASSGVRLPGGPQGSSSSPPSTSHCHAAIGRLKRTTFFNRQISQPTDSSATTNTACPADALPTTQQQPLMPSAGITKVAHVRLSLQLEQPQLLARELTSVLLALPPAWRTSVSSVPASTRFRISQPPADNSFKMLRQASSTPLAPICNFNRPHQSLSLISALSKLSLGTPLGLGGAQRTSQLS